MSGGGACQQAFRGLAVVTLSAFAIAAGPGTASATVPPKRCGKVEVGGKAYKVNTHRLKCKVARKRSRAYLKRGDHPAGWTCARYPPEETRIAFSCRKGGASYYAVRT